MSTHDKQVQQKEAHRPVDDGAAGIGSTNESQIDQARPTLSGILVPYLKSSFGLVIWFLFVFCGGVVFAVYYARIGYLPDIELNSAVFYLAAASLLGGSLIVLLSLLLFVPGAIWAKYLTGDPKLDDAFCEKEKEGGKKVIAPGKFLWRLIFWFFSFAFVWHLILIYSRWWYLLLCALVAVKAWRIRYREIKDCAKGAKLQRQLCISYFLRYGISVVSGLMAIFILFRFLGLSQTEYVTEHLAICTVGVVVGNAAVAVFLHEGRRGASFVSAIVIALLLIAATDRFDPVPNKILLRYGFGLDHVKIIVNQDAYKALQVEGFVEGNDSSPGPKLLSDVKILCRMGPNFFLEKGTKKITLAKSSIISWSIDQAP